MPELASAAAEGRLMEMFGCGTAAIVSPVGGVHYGGRMIQIPTPEDGVAQRCVFKTRGNRKCPHGRARYMGNRMVPKLPLLHLIFSIMPDLQKYDLLWNILAAKPLFLGRFSIFYRAQV